MNIVQIDSNTIVNGVNVEGRLQRDLKITEHQYNLCREQVKILRQQIDTLKHENTALKAKLGVTA